MANASIVYGAGTVKLIDFVVSSSGFSELMVKNGFKGVDVKQVDAYVSASINSLSAGKNLTPKEFAEVLTKLPVTGEDATMRKELQVLLDKSEDTIKKEDIVKAVNNIIYLSNRYGKSVVITCAECVSDSLAKSGFKFTVENIKNKSSAKLLAEVIPSNPQDLNKFIASKVKRLGLGDYSKVSPGVIAPEEEKSLALFLALAESGSDAYKDFARAIKEISTKNKMANIFSPSNPNKLWKVVTTDTSDEEVRRMTTLIDEANDIRIKGVNTESSYGANLNMTTEEAFNKALLKRSQGSEELIEKYKGIKNKRCFFK